MHQRRQNDQTQIKHKIERWMKTIETHRKAEVLLEIHSVHETTNEQAVAWVTMPICDRLWRSFVGRSRNENIAKKGGRFMVRFP